MSANATHFDGRKWLLRLGLLVLAVPVLLIIFVILPGAEHLLLGWIYFPLRTIPQFTIDLPVACLGGISLCAFIGGLHLFLRWFIRNVHTDDTFSSSAAQTWSWRSTLAASFILLLMFVAGTAMVGATHQFVWLLSGRPTSSSPPREPVISMVGAARSAAQQQQVAHNAAFMAMGVQNFHDSFQTLPPGGTKTEKGELLHGWAIFAAPFMLFGSERIDYAIPWNRPPNAELYKCNVGIFVNQSLGGPYFDDQGFGLSHFAGNQHVLPIRTVNVASLSANERRDSRMPQLAKTNQTMTISQITDGASNTLLLGTVSERFKPWGHPANIRDPSLGIDRSPDGFGGPPSWSGGVFSFCDGHTATINRKIDPRVLHQLATPAGGEPTVTDDAIKPQPKPKFEW
jgi:hypothetical protein